MTAKPEIPSALQALLDDHHAWPTLYTFKFIIPEPNLPEVLALFPDDQPQLRPSANGKYVSVTWVRTMDSSADVMAVYGRAREIKGLMAL